MDHSVKSCFGKASSSPSSSSSAANKDTISCHGDEEESGWTSYFEDFSKSNRESSHQYCSSLDGDGGGGGGSSLLSDAASYAAWKLSHHHQSSSNNNNNHALISSSRASPNLPKKLCFKKVIRAKQILEDDPLEDTASSPVNSPKVGDLSPSDENISSKIGSGHQLDGSMGKGSTSSEHTNNSDHLQIEDEVNFNEQNIECTELKKRELCLVPLSMLVNYLG